MSGQDNQKSNSDKPTRYWPTKKKESNKNNSLGKILALLTAFLIGLCLLMVLAVPDTDSPDADAESQAVVLNDQGTSKPTESDAGQEVVVQLDDTPTVTATKDRNDLAVTPTSEEEQDPPTATATTRPRVRIVSNAVNVRSGPGIDFDPVGVLYQDTVIPLVGTNDDQTWYKIELTDGAIGWIGSTVAIAEFENTIALAQVEMESDQVETNGTPPASTATNSATPTETPTITMTPTPTETGTPTMTPTSTVIPTETGTSVPPLYVEISNVSEFKDSEGDLVLMGEVVNMGSVPAKDIDIRSIFYDEAGNVLALESTYVETPLRFSLWFTGVLYPGETAPFKTYIKDPGEWETKKLEVLYEKAKTGDFADHYTDLEVMNDNGRHINDTLYNYHVTGEIKNVGEKTTGPVRVVITVYDEQGTVIGEALAHSEEDNLEPGQITLFRVPTYVRGQAATYALLIRAIGQ